MVALKNAGRSVPDLGVIYVPPYYDIHPDTEPVDGISEPQSIIDLVKQLLSRLDLSKEETENFIETMKDYGINMTV